LSRELIEAVGQQGQRGRHLKAFFGCIYYAAMRPGEVRGLKSLDCALPSQGWGELRPDSSSASVGSGWTDSGTSFDSRGLKKRARKSVRPVPIPPVLVRTLRAHVDEFGTAPADHLFYASSGGLVRSKEYPEIWRAARAAVLSKEEAATPLAETPYSLRHAAVSLWLSSGVPPAEVARRAGHSIAVLFRFYAKAIHGQEQQANERIEQALHGRRESWAPLRPVVQSATRVRGSRAVGERARGVSPTFHRGRSARLPLVSVAKWCHASLAA
jgi:integrase